MTSDQSDLFSAEKGDRLKREGMAISRDKRSDELIVARSIAMEHVLRYGEVTADDVGECLDRRGLADCLGPAAGSIFKTKDFEWTGKYVKSARVSNHSRMLRVWRLKGVNNGLT